ncbi:MAG: hypothetical protein OXI51_11020 [Chloroflexota bacterium]|nr:hypothetical protein [Chloroflexota bacterium]
MSQPDERDRRIQELEERLSRLSEASLRINESLDFETVSKQGGLKRFSAPTRAHQVYLRA